MAAERDDHEKTVLKPKQELCLWWATYFYEGKTQIVHFNIDIEERGQVPNASQLDPAQTQTVRLREEKGGTRGSVGLTFPV